MCKWYSVVVVFFFSSSFSFFECLFIECRCCIWMHFHFLSTYSWYFSVYFTIIIIIQIYVLYDIETSVCLRHVKCNNSVFLLACFRFLLSLSHAKWANGKRKIAHLCHNKRKQKKKSWKMHRIAQMVCLDLVPVPLEHSYFFLLLLFKATTFKQFQFGSTLKIVSKIKIVQFDKYPLVDTSKQTKKWIIKMRIM